MAAAAVSPGVPGPSAAERVRACHELETWLKPYKEEIMGVYVNVLVGHKPAYAAAFYVCYTAVLGSVCAPHAGPAPHV
jgi:hypothetical protein